MVLTWKTLLVVLALILFVIALLAAVGAIHVGAPWLLAAGGITVCVALLIPPATA